MKINSKKLFNSLSNVYSIVEKRNIKEILSNVKIAIAANKMRLYTTDLDIFAREEVDCEFDGDEIVTTVAIQPFFEILRKLPEESNIELKFLDNNSKMKISCNSTDFVLSCISSEDFPDFEICDDLFSFRITASDLSYLFSSTKHAISYDENRYSLNGIMLDFIENDGLKVLRAVSTDLHRIAIAEILNPSMISDYKIIVPRKTVLETLKLLANFEGELVVSVSKNKISFIILNTTIVSKLIDANFPDYISVIPFNNSKILKVSRSKFLNGINLVTSVLTTKPKVIKLTLVNNQITLSVNDNINISTGNIEIEAIYSDDTMSICMDSKYLVDILSNINGNEILIKLESPSKPLLIEDSGNYNSRFVLMPVEI